MAAPQYVPTPVQQDKHYQSSKKTKHNSGISRPAEISVNQAHRSGTGNPGPDQGFALRLVKGFKESVYLSASENWSDASEVAVITALKRASLFGRAPCHYDLEAGFCAWGYLDPEPSKDLLEIRETYFPHIGSSHNYLKRRKVADAVISSALRQSHKEICRTYELDWRNLIDPKEIQES
ncbi:MAG: hypothetical protein CBC37_00195 [Acidimicrobiaceae bacterium TMED77]|nr:hypothetical protein [Acidimicrobiales bacterium]OUV01547.1 MAG: hypothetical protein CBC37_00195 [Acidimicrobiaceae bacterium TMED77]|tara:strand:+ start:83944 stop:84480 length:537 start_codon:yes stop_codon:yes gene_type:complete